MPEATDYKCLEMSPDGFICNRDPNHDGDHEAKAGRGRVVDAWPRRIARGPE